MSSARTLALGRRVERDEEIGILPEEDVVYDDEACRLAAMSRKKLHEVDRLSRVIFRVAERQNADSIIDVGAGHGYLTHLLAHQNPSRRLYAIDCDDARTCGSKDRGTRIVLSNHHRHPTRIIADHEKENPVIYVTARLDPQTLPELLEAHRYVLVGLHSCGDLSGLTMLRTFLECEGVKGIVVVGCCYHRIHVEREGDESQLGFPLSNNVRSLIQTHHPSFSLTYRSLTTACLTFASFDNPSTILSALRGHYHRSLFELLLRSWKPARTLSPGQLRVGGLPKSATQDFQSYCVAACTKLGLCTSDERRESLIDAIRKVEVDKEKMIRRIAFMCVMRSFFGPCVESLVLLDRMMYLKEGLGIPLDQEKHEGKGRVWLRNLFDYAESPRNMVVVAEKAACA
ncbi:hypothetical protein SpCBS45565_g07939 [Spizellomyces sp. 'palustris']|nr:hypothetical protein SpCBS45565_g07939 [Spizellomyces sp. 'palustris']